MFDRLFRAFCRERPAAGEDMRVKQHTASPSTLQGRKICPLICQRLYPIKGKCTEMLSELDFWASCCLWTPNLVCSPVFSAGGPPSYFQTGIRCLHVPSLPLYRYLLEFRHYLDRSFMFELGLFHQPLLFNLLEGSVI